MISVRELVDPKTLPSREMSGDPSIVHLHLNEVTFIFSVLIIPTNLSRVCVGIKFGIDSIDTLGWVPWTINNLKAIDAFPPTVLSTNKLKLYSPGKRENPFKMGLEEKAIFSPVESLHLDSKETHNQVNERLLPSAEEVLDASIKTSSSDPRISKGAPTTLTEGFDGLIMNVTLVDELAPVVDTSTPKVNVPTERLGRETNELEGRSSSFPLTSMHFGEFFLTQNHLKKRLDPSGEEDLRALRTIRSAV